jgi:hypothetical protein
MLVLIAKAKGTQAALQRYAELKKFPSAEYKVEERTLNSLGYTLLFSGQMQDVITVFQRNVQVYPESGNVYGAELPRCLLYYRNQKRALPIVSAVDHHHNLAAVEAE